MIQQEPVTLEQVRQIVREEVERAFNLGLSARPEQQPTPRDGYEYRHGRVPGAALLPWTEAWKHAGDAPTGELAVICGGEVRSSLVASILRRHGRSVRLVVGGMVDWNERGYPVEKQERKHVQP